MEASLEVEMLIRMARVGLEVGSEEALGSWDGDTLAAIVVYAPLAGLWKVTLLATAIDYRRRKQATRLLHRVIADAKAADASAVSCFVREDNGPMLSLIHHKFIAVIDAPIDGYHHCTIPTDGR